MSALSRMTGVGRAKIGTAWQRARRRLLCPEPPEFRRLAADVLMTGVIEGWRVREDLVLLYLLARDLSGDGTVLEIGSYKGLSTAALAFGAIHGGRRLPIHTVDPHTGDRQVLEAGEGDEWGSSVEEFERNMRWAGIEDAVVAHVMRSDELAARWPGEPVRLLFVDGWHSYGAVRRDLDDWLPLLSPHGAVVVDDYANYDEVRDAVDDSWDELPPHRRPAGRMILASNEPLSPAVERHLRLPWG
jgi:predicted O-methyltransferase YrrM